MQFCFLIGNGPELITALTYHSVVACTIHEIARAAAC